MLAFLLVAFGGVFLLVRGLRPRRRGSTVYCRKCGYNLTGLDLHAASHGKRPCPECGLDLTLVDSVVIGMRVRRPLLAGIGLLMVLVGGWPIGVAGVAVIQGVSWYSKLPTWWVLSDLHGGDGTIAHRAWSEMEARFAAGALSAGQQSRLIDAYLDEQARANLRPIIGREMVNLLGDPTIESAMTLGQQRRYANNLARNLTLLIRPRVVADEPFIIWFNRDSRVPLNRVCSLRLTSFTCNGREIEQQPHIGRSSGCGSTGNGIEHRRAESGQAVLKATVRMELHGRDYDPREQANPPLLTSDPIKLTAVTDVLRVGETDDVKLIRSKSTDAAIVSSTYLEASVVASSAVSNAFSVVGQVTFDPPPPCNLAFDIIVELEGDWRLRGTIEARPGPTIIAYALPSPRIEDATPEKIDLVLRASRDAARRTPDMFEIWGGSLRFKDLPVKSSVPWPRPRVPAILDED